MALTPIAAGVLIADTPGPTCTDMRRIAFTRVTRPFYPMDWNDAPG